MNVHFRIGKVSANERCPLRGGVRGRRFDCSRICILALQRDMATHGKSSDMTVYDSYSQ